jgi:hypothetical protein
MDFKIESAGRRNHFELIALVVKLRQQQPPLDVRKSSGV